MTDGGERSALAVVRSLGKAGYRVCVASSSGRSLAGASKYAARDVRVGDALTEPDGFAARVERLSAEESASVVLPISESALLALLPVRNRITGIIPFPSLESFRQISDKRALLAEARALGIATPEQTVLENRAGLDEIARKLRYPLVVKPARSIGESHGARSKLAVRYAGSQQDLRHVLESLGPGAYPVLLQQRIVGPGVGIFLLLWKGEELARFAHRRIREKPPAGGVSVYRESIVADLPLVALSRRLLDRFQWEGVAMVEYKIEEMTGIPFLMEVNGRFWGSLQLAVDSGVDFPRLLVEAALGKAPAAVTAYQEGIRSRWWWGDVDQLLARMTKSASRLSLPADAPGRTRALLDFLAIWRRGDRNEILRWRDPGPFARETLEWFKAL